MRAHLVLLVVLVACTGPAAPTVDTDPPISTADTGRPATPADPWFDEGALTWGSNFGKSVAVLNENPLIVAITRGGSTGGDFDVDAEARIVSADLDGGMLTPMGQVGRTTGVSMGLNRVRDVTGDGVVDLSVTSQPFQVVPGPDWASPLDLPGMTLEHTPLTECDGGNDGIADLCSSLGIDLNPIDGVPDVTWQLPNGANLWVLASGRRSGDAVSWVLTGTLGVGHAIAAIALPATGSVDVTAHPAWNIGELDSVRVAPVDADADGADGLLVCGELADAWSLRLIDPFPLEAAGSFALPGVCTAMEVADYDGDGDLEVAIGAGARVLIVDPVTWTLLAEHTGTVDPLQDDFGAALDSADLNGDGRADLVVGAPGSGRVYFLTEVIP